MSKGISRFYKKQATYLIHTVVLFVSTGFLCGGFYLLTGQPTILTYVLVFISNVLALHYLMDIVHASSHSQLSPKLFVNRFFGMWAATLSGLTFDDFRATHILHHKFPDTDKDPDKEITLGGSLATIPFRVWYHDRWFWQKGLWKKRNAWKGYLLTRLIQIGIVSMFFFSGNILLWISFWLVPVLVVGYANALFLFFFPHYNHAWEGFFKDSSNPLKKSIQWMIDMSRYYHELHHDNTRMVQAYYPMFSYMSSLNNPLGSLRNSYVYSSRRQNSTLDRLS